MFQPPSHSRLSTSGQARRAAEALFQSSENPPPTRPRAPRSRPIRQQEAIVSIRRFVVGRLLDMGRYSRAVEFVELPRTPGKALGGEGRAPIFLLVSGRGGRTLYLALEDEGKRAEPLPKWWARLGDLGHNQRRVRARTATEAWRQVHLILRKLGFAGDADSSNAKGGLTH